MQTEYACAMAVASLTPQTKTWRKKNHPHPEESECLTTKNKNFTCTNRYEGIITTKKTRALHNDVADCCSSERRSVHGARALVASRLGGVAASVAVVKAKRRGEAAPPSLPLLQETCACHPPKSAPPYPQCLRRMHPRLTLEPPDLAFALLSSLIDLELISANHHP